MCDARPSASIKAAGCFILSVTISSILFKYSVSKRLESDTFSYLDASSMSQLVACKILNSYVNPLNSISRVF